MSAAYTDDDGVNVTPDDGTVYFLTSVSNQNLLNFVDGNEQTLPQNSVAANNSIDDETVTPEMDESTEATTEEEPEPVEKKKSNGSNLILYVIVGLVAFVVISVKVLGGKKGKADQNDDELYGEGELIFRLVYTCAKCSKPIERLWISSMEESAILSGFQNLRPGKEYDNLYESALARQKADWLVGINGTRLFTVLYNGKMLRVGRVQTPTFAMLVDRETEIMDFKKEPFYTVCIDADGVLAVSEKIKDKEKAEQVMKKVLHKSCEVMEVTKEERQKRKLQEKQRKKSSHPYTLRSIR